MAASAKNFFNGMLFLFHAYKKYAAFISRASDCFLYPLFQPSCLRH